MSKILKGEAKAQATSLQAAVKDLARLQKVQKNAAAVCSFRLYSSLQSSSPTTLSLIRCLEKEESKALKNHTKAVENEQRQSAIFAKAKAAFDAATLELRSATENLEASRTHALQQTETLKTKTLEVEQATRQKATDDVCTCTSIFPMRRRHLTALFYKARTRGKACGAQGSSSQVNTSLEYH
jgi:hypothetical protein